MARTEAQNRATYKYAKEHLKRIPLDVQLDEYAQIKAAADLAGESVNGYIKEAIRARLATDPVTAAGRASGADPTPMPTPPGDMSVGGEGRVTPVSTSKQEKASSKNSGKDKKDD